MKEFVEKLIGRLEKFQEISKVKGIYGEYRAYSKSMEIVNQLAEEYKEQHIDQDLMIVESLPSLYPMMQPFEEEAIHRVVGSAKYKNGWILCSEGLPDKDMWCLATFESGGIDKIQYLFLQKWWNGEMGDNRVIAWQPLPEPYKPEGE